MLILEKPDNLTQFREICRPLLKEKINPSEVVFRNKYESLFGLTVQSQPSTYEHSQNATPSNFTAESSLFLPKECLQLLDILSCHRSNDIWDLLYRLVFNIQKIGATYLQNAADPDVIDSMRRKKQVTRDIHKMHAFVRFRKITTKDDQSEQLIAWHKPEHKIIPKGAVFFAKRFPGMNWSILSPDTSVHWNGKFLTFGPGVEKNPLTSTDVIEAWWLTYYEAIFNPARVKMKAMKKEMPTKYWESMPETQIISRLLKDAPARVKQMQERALEMTLPRIQGTYPELKEKCIDCKNCQISCLGGKAVFGEGSTLSEIMVVGEQVGDEEDKTGKVFVGPAGQLLNRVLLECNLNRDDLYITNAVKHFKWALRGERRIHKTPTGVEILSCRRWLEAEMELIRPKVIICLGRVAAQSVLGIQMKINEAIREKYKGPFNSTVLVTYHPSSVLRATTEIDRLNKRNQIMNTVKLAQSLVAFP